jgi:hypothetical protein
MEMRTMARRIGGAMRTTSARRRWTVWSATLGVSTTLVLVFAFGSFAGSRMSGIGLTHQEFVKQGNAICVDLRSRVAALAAPTTFSELSVWADAAIVVLAEDGSKLAALKAPAADRSGFKSYVVQTRKGVDVLMRLRAAAVRQDAAEIKRLQAESRQDSAASTKIAKRLGLTQCGGR